jgi:prevent-host-death family protein
MASMTASAADARANFSRIAGEVARSGVPVTVFKNSRPWVVIQPAVPEIPNAATRAAVQEGRGMAERQPRFEGFADMMAALNADA